MTLVRVVPCILPSVVDIIGRSILNLNGKKNLSELCTSLESNYLVERRSARGRLIKVKVMLSLSNSSYQ